MLPDLILPLLGGLLPEEDLALPPFGLGHAGVERLPGVRDLRHLPFEARVELVELLPLPVQGRLAARRPGVAVLEQGLPRRELALPRVEGRGPLREAPALGLRLRAGPLRLHRGKLLLRLQLDIPRAPLLLELAEEHRGGLLDGLELGPEGLELLLAHRAPPELLLQLPFPAVQLLLLRDELPLLLPALLELPEVRLPGGGLLPHDGREVPVDVPEALDRRLWVRPLELVDADRRMPVVVRPDLDLGPLARRIPEDLGEGVGPKEVRGGPMLREDPVPAPEHEDPLGGQVPPEHGRLEEPVELQRAEVREDPPQGLGAPVGDPLHAAGREVHRARDDVIT
ncbi:MAG: hypothetical protein A3K59_00890 [Euryarchaeota archaeon RBG_19FT_COMBO_69_17]|nr:MAG: hypothetical protein A3K59_00890 [Euryarchaeota archaeon RBG_19FT_COMBO_69_17]